MNPSAKTLTVAPHSRQVLWIRTAAGPGIGYGHLRRCLTLAEAIQDCCTPLFLLDPDDTWSREHLAGQDWDFDCGGLGTAWGRLPDPAGILIDTRRTDGLASFLVVARSRGIPVISIHDLGLAPVASHIAVDGSIVPASGEGFLRSTRCLNGPDFMILDPVYSFLHRSSKRINQEVRSVFINLGGGDSRKYFPIVLDGLKQWALDLEVIGVPGFVHWGQEMLGDRDWTPLHFRWETENIEHLLFQSDLAITAGGLSVYEALCAGTPAAAFSYDPLQQRTITALAGKSACFDLGPGDALDPVIVFKAVSSLNADIQKRRRLSALGKEVVDGCGAERVALVIRQVIDSPVEHGRPNVSGTGF